MTAPPLATSLSGSVASPLATGPNEPLYEQCARVLLGEICTGGLIAGARLPSERALADALGFSRLTVRRALFALAADGAIEPAKRGWQVAAGPLSDPPNTLMSFSAMAASRGLVASSKVLSVVTRPALVDEADDLRIAPGSSIVEGRRLRMLNGEAIAVETMRLPVARAPWVDSLDWSGSVHEALERHGLAPWRASVLVDVVAAEADETELLGVAVGRGLLRLVGVTTDRHGVPVCLDHVRYHPDRYRFRAILERRADAGRSSQRDAIPFIGQQS